MEQEVDEIEDEHAHDLALLEDLLSEFEPELTAILQDRDRGITGLLDFWRHTWANRMTQVEKELCGNQLSDDERRAAEEIGVVWDRPPPLEEGQLYKSDSDSDLRDVFGEPWASLDYLSAKLEEIEVE
ncbi:792b4b44-d3df-438b-909a-0ff499880675 [Thermothielavioides terrestris]|jgi:hypothetical protein|uniref:Uncharacterized protein n=2 Tax=Thermothielavioides terrestris TaxID=2587410 RepID=G2RB89_THETT|nr:uncharacterized protein THITE_155713 [Thermothielavioides terrestris NRRL 8126]AEO69060.1 hypothetical protein THITE_155713 [Thermothielavioides terrestris NRRL 8126]SPQ22662.1 792b4b44-d3df-438b-909a-0ff499880675 [Thermothielavioides terrestris]